MSKKKTRFYESTEIKKLVELLDGPVKCVNDFLNIKNPLKNQDGNFISSIESDKHIVKLTIEKKEMNNLEKELKTIAFNKTIRSVVNQEAVYLFLHNSFNYSWSNERHKNSSSPSIKHPYSLLRCC